VIIVWDEYQTRSEEHGINYFHTLEEAIEAAEHDKTIWKISYTDERNERVRLVKQKDMTWVHEPLLIR
jgi:hypothetical protein